MFNTYVTTTLSLRGGRIITLIDNAHTNTNRFAPHTQQEVHTVNESLDGVSLISNDCPSCVHLQTSYNTHKPQGYPYQIDQFEWSSRDTKVHLVTRLSSCQSDKVLQSTL